MVVPPAIWMGSDWLVTGDPMYSSNYTTRSALSLGRQVPIEQLPERLLKFMNDLTKLPVLAAGVLGLVLAFRLVPWRRLLVPSFLLVFGIATFLALSIRGFAVINRYLVVSALALTLFAAFTLGGFALLDGRARRAWAAASAVVVLLGVGWTVSKFSAEHIRWELQSRQVIHDDMVRLLADPEVRRARACGPVTVPNHKLVPDIRYLLDASADEVLPRTRLPEYGRGHRGVAIYVTGRRLLQSPAYGPFDQLNDSPLIQVPGDDFRLVGIGSLPGRVRELRLTYTRAGCSISLKDSQPATSEPATPAASSAAKSAFVPRSNPSVFRQKSITRKWKRKTPKETFPSQRAGGLSAQRAPCEAAASTSAPNATGTATASHSDWRASSRAVPASAAPLAYRTATAPGQREPAG